MHLQRPAETVMAYDESRSACSGLVNCRTDRWVAAEIAASGWSGRFSSFFGPRTCPIYAATSEQKLSLADQAIGASR